MSTLSLKPTPSRWHFVATLLLAIALVPALRYVGLPLKINWGAVLQAYWIAFSFQSIFAATLLCLIAFPIEKTLKPAWLRYKSDKRRLLLQIPFLLFLFFLCAGFRSLLLFPFLVVAMLAILELFERSQTHSGLLSNVVSSILIPAAYLFVGLLLLSAYNDIAVASRPNVTYDAFFNRVDSSILAGMTVSETVHHALKSLPLGIFRFLEFIYYYCMFPQIGAALILMALTCGRRQSLRFVGTLLTAYYLALALFWLWPSQGPFFLCARHFVEFPSDLVTG